MPIRLGGRDRVPETVIFRIDIGYVRGLVIDWFGEEPVVRLLNGRLTDVAGL